MDFMTGVHALVFLHHRQQTVCSEQIARNVCAHPVQIRKVMSALAKAGLIKRQRGVNGGYRIADGCDPTLADVAQALDWDFMRGAWTSGDSDKDCVISSGMAHFARYLHDQLSEVIDTTLQSITISSIEEKLTSHSPDESSPQST